MKLFYAAVFRETTPLVVYSPEPGNYEKIFVEKMGNTIKDVGKTYRKVDNCLWVISHDEQDLNILMVVQNTNDKDIIDQFCDEIKSRFLRAHGSEWKNAQAHELYTRFEPTFRLVKQMIEVSSIDKNRITEVYPPTGVETNLSEYSSTFIGESNRTRKNLRFQNCCKTILIILFILTLIYIIFVFYCGGYDLKPNCIKE